MGTCAPPPRILGSLAVQEILDLLRRVFQQELLVFLVIFIKVGYKSIQGGGGEDGGRKRVWFRDHTWLLSFTLLPLRWVEKIKDAYNVL